MITNITEQKPPFQVIRDAREGEVIDLPVGPVHYLKNEFEKKTKKSFWSKAVNASSFVAPLFAANLYGFTTPKTLSGIFGTVALSVATAVATSYLAYQGNKFLINRAKEKTDRKIQDYLDELTQAADSNAQRHFILSLNDRFRSVGYIKMHELGKLVNIDEIHLKDTDYNLRLTVSRVKDWLKDSNISNVIPLRSIEKKALGINNPAPPTSSLKARTHYPTCFRLTVLNLRSNAELVVEKALSGLQDFKDVMFGNPKADDYLDPYSTTHKVSAIFPTFQVKRIIEINRSPDMQRKLPALDPREYQ